MSLIRDEPAKAEAFRFVLRRQTAADHAALDSLPAFLAMAGGSLDLDDYRRLMHLMHDLYVCLDEEIEDACDRFGLGARGFRYQARVPMLACDLAALNRGNGLPAAAVESTRPVATAASLTGMLYVVEGSLLGGATLHAASEAILQGAGSGGNGYWEWCRRAGGTRWGMTCRLIEELAMTQQQQTEMVAAARATFRRFGSSLRRWHGGAADGNA